MRSVIADTLVVFGSGATLYGAWALGGLEAGLLIAGPAIIFIGVTLVRSSKTNDRE